METLTAVKPEAAAPRNGAANGRLFAKLEELRPDPDQPRKHFDPEKLKELAASIVEQGIIQDLIVSAVEKGKPGDGHYIIVDGERRWRAAQLAGLKTVPVAVRHVDEKTKLALQVVANQQREALTALEEAAAYRKEIDSGRQTAESLYKVIGISRGTLFSRLALNRLHPPVRAALEAGKISVSVAGLVSMVPEVKQQEELLEELTDDSSWQYPWSVRDVRERVEEDYCKSLSKAPFDTGRQYAGEFKEENENGATVVRNLTQRGACKDCKFRSGNMEGIDVGTPNICTRPKCFEAKAAAHWTAQSVKAQASGQRVIDGKEWRKISDQYCFTDEKEYIAGKMRTWKDAMGGQGEKLTRVLVQAAGGPREAVLRKEAKEAAKANGVKIVDYDADNVRWRAEQKKRAEKTKRMGDVVKLAASTLVLKASRPVKEINVAFLKDLCELAIRSSGSAERILRERPRARECKGRDPWDQVIDYARNKMCASEENLVGLLVDCLIDPSVNSWEGTVGEGFVQACRIFGVDLKKVEEGMKGKSVTLQEIKSASKTKAKKVKPQTVLKQVMVVRGSKPRKTAKSKKGVKAKK